MRERKIITAIERALEEDCVSLTFDDVLVVPRESDVVPAEVSLETKLSPNIPLHIPLVGADMDTVTEDRTSIGLARKGGIGFLWKAAPDLQERWVANVKSYTSARIDSPVFIHDDQRFEDVYRVLEENGGKFSTLVVLDKDRRVAGLVLKQKTRLAKPSDLVRDFMVTDLVTMPAEEDKGYEWAYNIMRQRKIGKLVIVDEEGRLKGLYCSKDVKPMVEGNDSFLRDDLGRLRVGANVGVLLPGRNDKEFGSRVEAILKRGCDALLVGTAHGHSRNVMNTVTELATNFKPSHHFDIIAGNVATYDGARALFLAGADTVKVGIGPGSICTTRIVTGVGVPQITAIHEAAKAAAEFDRYIIGDGGIRYSGDITKALVAGADCVMLGSLFAGTDEAPGEKVTIKGHAFKVYRGMGSQGAMMSSSGAKERYRQESGKLVSEGVESKVPYKGPIEEVIDQLMGGLRSGMGYDGVSSIFDLMKFGDFTRITASGIRESHPHDVEVVKEEPNYAGK
jgi:IMP dehydrogenase